MAKIDIGKGLKGKIQGAVDSAKAAAKEVKLPDVKAVVSDVTDSIKKKGKDSAKSKSDSETLEIKIISTRSALKIIYYLMAVDGELFHSEEEKFDSIGRELDPDFAEHKEQIIAECQTQLDSGTKNRAPPDLGGAHAAFRGFKRGFIGVSLAKLSCDCIKSADKISNFILKISSGFVVWIIS